MTGSGITGTPLKVLLRFWTRQIRRFTRIVLVRAGEQEIRPILWDKAGTIVVDSAEGLFGRDGKTIALYSIKPARITIRPTTPNPDRVVLYTQGGHRGRTIFYYKTDTERLLLAHGDSLVTWQRDDISALRNAIRKFTRTARPDLTRKPGKPFSEYPPP